MEMHERLFTLERGVFTPAELVAALTHQGHAALGWPEAGRIAVGAPGRPRRRPAGLACGRPEWLRRRRSTRRPPRTSAPWCRPGGSSSGTASTCSATSADCWPRPSNRCGRTHEQRPGHRDRRAGHQRPGLGRRQPARRRASAARWCWRPAGSPGWAPRSQAPDADTQLDLGGRAVVPGFVDSHSHLVFAGDRAREFEARMTGTPYDGGGIATTVAATRAAPDELLLARTRALVAEMRAQGTTTVEVKSGYGLTVADEARSLRMAARGDRRDDVPRRARGARRGGPRRVRRRWSPARCSRPARRTPAGSTCSASRPASTPSTATRRARC